MSSLPNRLQRAPPSDSLLPLHHATTSPAADPAGPSTHRPRPSGLRIPTWLSTSAAPSPIDGPASPTSPAYLGTPTSPSVEGRRRAHTVAVSFGRPRALSSEERPLVGAGGAGTGAAAGASGSILPTHRESNDESRHSHDASERRRESIISRIRSSIDERERRDSLHSHNPVGYEVRHHPGHGADHELQDEVVGLLDVVDTQVSTVNHLQNVTNGIFIPHLPALWSRRPEIILRPSDEDVPKPTDSSAPATARTRRSTTSRPRSSTVAALFPPSAPSATTTAGLATAPTSPTGDSATIHHPLATIQSIPLPSPTPTPPATGPLPKSADSPSSSTDGLTPAEEDDLDLHVRRQLKKSKREKTKELLKGTWVFLKTPIGVFVGIYGVLVVFWGAALVLILINAVKVGDQDTKNYWVEICSQILTALFTITGVGLIPWRAQDTYRMAIITMYKRRTKVKRRKLGLPPIADENDLPDPKDQADYIAVLTEKEQAALVYQQEKFAKSQTWYKPHATATHKAFPITWALWNTVLMDGNSIFQCFLCGVMWGITWTTGSLIPLSFLCGIFAGVLIWQGGKRTKKVASVEDKLRQALGVPLAIGMPTTKDGTIITGANKSPINVKDDLPKSKPADGSSAGSGEAENADEGSPAKSTRDLIGPDEEEEVILGPNKKVEVRNTRRSTVTFGQIENPLLGDVKKEAEVAGRSRGRTVAGVPGAAEGEGIELEKVRSDGAI